MKYTMEERLDIAKRVYDREMTVEEAAIKYGLHPSSIKRYLRLYRAETGLPVRNAGRISTASLSNIKAQKDSDLKEYEEMSREELIDALVMARINEARLKKGYCVKGSGVSKEYIPIDSKNIK